MYVIHYNFTPWHRTIIIGLTVSQTEPEYEKDKLTKFLDGLLRTAANEGKVKAYFG